MQILWSYHRSNTSACARVDPRNAFSQALQVIFLPTKVWEAMFCRWEIWSSECLGDMARKDTIGETACSFDLGFHLMSQAGIFHRIIEIPGHPSWEQEHTWSLKTVFHYGLWLRRLGIYDWSELLFLCQNINSIVFANMPSFWQRPGWPLFWCVKRQEKWKQCLTDGSKDKNVWHSSVSPTDTPWRGLIVDHL